MSGSQDKDKDSTANSHNAATSRLRKSLRKALNWTGRPSATTSATSTPEEAKKTWLNRLAKVTWVRGATEGGSRAPENTGHDKNKDITEIQDQSPGDSGEVPKTISRANTYQELEDAMRMSRLEDHHTLMAALRLLVRRTHPKGKTICFPIPEAADDLALGCKGLPKDIKELEQLTRKAFQRRDRELDLESVYKDFVRAHGRMTFDPTKVWPNSRVNIKDP
jgi:hypothetical protein